MPQRRRVLFLTGTRADFGKLRPLLTKMRDSNEFEIFIFTTGMHMLRRYGSTWEEVDRAKLGRVYMFVNQNDSDSMDSVFAKTASGLSDLIKELEPDLVVVHGDRVEALAGAIVATLNRVLVAHIEGGEVSGTVDEMVRHSVTKMSHIHFVSNDHARRRLLQLGETATSIHVIGSPEVDVMSSPNLPTIETVKSRYEIDFEEFALLVFHPVTTELPLLRGQAQRLVDFVLQSGINFVAIMPNNDDGTFEIQAEFERFSGNPRIRLLPSMRFESYLTALKHARFILGNSSSGVREASYFGVPAVDLGTRQANRSSAKTVVNSGFQCGEIERAVNIALSMPRVSRSHFGDGKSAERFVGTLRKDSTWEIPVQKAFVDRPSATNIGTHRENPSDG